MSFLGDIIAAPFEIVESVAGAIADAVEDLEI